MASNRWSLSTFVRLIGKICLQNDFDGRRMEESTPPLHVSPSANLANKHAMGSFAKGLKIAFAQNQAFSSSMVYNGNLYCNGN